MDTTFGCVAQIYATGLIGCLFSHLLFSSLQSFAEAFSHYGNFLVAFFLFALLSSCFCLHGSISFVTYRLGLRRKWETGLRYYASYDVHVLVSSDHITNQFVLASWLFLSLLSNTLRIANKTSSINMVRTRKLLERCATCAGEVHLLRSGELTSACRRDVRDSR